MHFGLEPVGHISPLPRIDIRYPGRPKVITWDQVQNGTHKEPCAEAYKYDIFEACWRLKE